MLKRRNIFIYLIIITLGCFQVSHASNSSNNTLAPAASNNTGIAVFTNSDEQSSWDSTLRLQNPKDLIFKVVIGTFVEPLDIECSFLRKVRDDMTVEKTEEGRVRYAIGAFDNYEKARTHCNGLIAEGYRHAEILAYDKENILAMPIEYVLEWLAQQ